MSHRKLVCALLILVAGCATRTVTPPADGIDAETLAKYRQQFRTYNLPYRLPRGCDAVLRCAMSADLNDDGIADFAGLYEYAGSIRRGDGGRHLDLVILYSRTATERPGSVIFTHVGRLDGAYRTTVGLEVQPPGPFKLPTGSIRLDRPAINLVDAARPDDLYLPTYYWQGDKFHSISKADD
jgi:hypothetical protein